tara:strand:- start:272 stop:838 length:567 start_codon:yes stop_codon:yes gene_type:complete
MAKERTQLNINIDPQLLVKLKSEAIKSGKTLTDFVVEQLKKTSEKSSESSLEERLLRIEKILFLNEDSPEDSQKLAKKIGTIFTDQGAKLYGEIARSEFESHVKKMGLTIPEALQELANHLKNYPYSNPELIFQILLGTHNLTGLEMTNAYRHGSCAMRSALNDWTKDPLEKLNEAFLNAVIIKSLAN